MSRKVNQFTGIITRPLNLYNFLVTIPGIQDAVVVESTAFPTEKFRVVELWFQGEKVRYPGLPENDGSWKIKIPENDDGRIKFQFDALKGAMYNQQTGIMNPALWLDIPVLARDMQNNPVFQCILHGVWIQGRDQVELANNDPAQSWKWDYNFQYQWIEDLPIKRPGQGSPNPLG